MRLRATVKIRNDAMVSAREARGWSQHDLARATKVPYLRVIDFEALRYDGIQDLDRLTDEACQVAAVLGIPTEAVLPEDLKGHRIASTATRVAEIPIRSLLAAAHIPSALPGPMETAERNEIATLVRGALKSLTFREQRVLSRRFGLDEKEVSSVSSAKLRIGRTWRSPIFIGPARTYEEVAQEFEVTRERIRQIEAKALRKLAHPRLNLERLSKEEV